MPKSCVSKFRGAQNCASKLQVTILLRDPLTIPAAVGGAPRYSGAGEGVAPWYTIGALSRYARARHEVGTRFLQHETMRVRPASLSSPARHGAVCCYLAQYYDVSFS